MDTRQAIDAQRIREVEFRERMRGYHQEDVDDFLEQVARGVEELERQLAAAKEELAALKARGSDVPAQSAPTPSGDVIQRTLIVAQRAADQLREEAEREARELRAEAQRQAERVLAEARTTSRLIEEERRKNLMEELSDLDAEIRRRQEQLGSLLKRDKLVREKISEELGALLSALRNTEWEPEARATDAAPAPAEVVRESEDESEPKVELKLDGATDTAGLTEFAVATDPSEEDPTEPRAVQDFVFGHSIDEADEPFLLWRQDPEA